MMETSELLAKVLSSENLNVIKKNVRTAMFDITNRTLILPTWKDMEPVVEEMLVLHETAHALFSPEKYIEAIKARKAISNALNVVEDARIERLMKELYPGSRKSFAAGYKALRDADFFEIKDLDVNSFNLIDRINLYFKAGVVCGVKFSKEESVFVTRALNIVTIEEAIQLANDIVDFVKDEGKETQSVHQDLDGFEFEFTDEEEGDEEGSSFEDEGGSEANTEKSGKFSQSKDGNGEDEIDASTESKTMETLERKLSEKSGEGNPTNYTEFPEDYRDDIIVGYKEIFNICDKFSYDFAEDDKRIKDNERRFKQKYKNQVNHIVSIFELRKAAKVYAMRSIRKTGLIDTTKIAQYKVKDDLFLKRAVFPEGQNHGMVMLLDWSASMDGQLLRNSIKQVIQLVMFCRQVGVPYRVFAFSDSIRSHNTVTEADRENMGAYVSLLELFTNEMNLQDHNRMIGLAYSGILRSRNPLGNTPLAPALLYMRKYLPQFKAANKIDKLNFITFTDGCNTYSNIRFKDSEDVYIKDALTKKNYFLGTHKGYEGSKAIRRAEVSAMYSMIRERYDANVITFFATRDTLINSAMDSGYGGHLKSEEVAEFTKNGFVELKGYGRDSIYIVKQSILQDEEFNLSGITPDMTAAKVAGAIKKNSKSSIKAKIMIQKFAECIS
jgi:hypothetical protein